MFKLINLDTKKLIEDFVSVRIQQNPIDGNYHFSWNYMYNFLKRNHSNFYDVLDNCLVVIKKVRMNKAQYDRLVDFPIHKSGNIETEIKLFDNLFSAGIVQQAMVPEHRLSLVDNKYEKGEVIDNNFFNYVPEALEKRNGQWLKKHKVRFTQRDNRFQFRKLEVSDFEQCTKLYVNWSENKQVYDKVMFDEYFKNFQFLLDKLMQFGLFFDNQLIGWVSFIPMNQGYCYQVMENSYTEPPIGDNTLKKVCTQIGQVLDFWSLEKIGGQYISYAGAPFSDKNLYNHKTECSTGKIEYFRVTPKEKFIITKPQIQSILFQC